MPCEEGEEGLEGGTLVLMWCLWRERNRRILEDVQMAIHRFID